jgi:hypothetical protein
MLDSTALGAGGELGGDCGGGMRSEALSCGGADACRAAAFVLRLSAAAGGAAARTALGGELVRNAAGGVGGAATTAGFRGRTGAGARWFAGFANQPLAASCRTLPRHTKAQSWHTQSELVGSPSRWLWLIEICRDLYHT